MSKLKLHAGDFVTISPNSNFRGGNFNLATEERTWKFINTEALPASELTFLSVAREDAVKSVGGTVGWDAAGAVILGPAGLLAGLLLGGRSKSVTFIAKFRDGRKVIGTTDSKTWIAIQAAAIHLI